MAEAMTSVYDAAGGHDGMLRLAEAYGSESSSVLPDYFAWATRTTMSRYLDSADDVPAELALPRWSWDGPQ